MLFEYSVLLNTLQFHQWFCMESALTISHLPFLAFFISINKKVHYGTMKKRKAGQKKKRITPCFSSYHYLLSVGFIPLSIHIQSIKFYTSNFNFTTCVIFIINNSSSFLKHLTTCIDRCSLATYCHVSRV